MLPSSITATCSETHLWAGLSLGSLFQFAQKGAATTGQSNDASQSQSGEPLSLLGSLTEAQVGQTIPKRKAHPAQDGAHKSVTSRESPIHQKLSTAYVTSLRASGTGLLVSLVGLPSQHTRDVHFNRNEAATHRPPLPPLGTTMVKKFHLASLSLLWLPLPANRQL